jgi:hypothetical protein
MKNILFVLLAALALTLCGCKKADASTTLEDLQTIGKMVQVDKMSPEKAMTVLQAQHSQFNYEELTTLLATRGITLPAQADEFGVITVSKKAVAVAFCAACVTYGFLFM